MATELAALLGFSVAVAVTADFAKTHMGLPGHSAVIWMPVLLLAGYRRPGMTAGASLVGGGMASALGVMRPHELAALMISAAVVEAFGLSMSGRWRAPMLIAAGICGNLGKLAMKVVTSGLMGLPLNKMALPFMPTFAIYVAAGLIAGFIALGIIFGWDRLRRERARPGAPTTE